MSQASNLPNKLPQTASFVELADMGYATGVPQNIYATKLAPGWPNHHNPHTPAVPEPSTYLLLALGIVVIAVYKKFSAKPLS